MKTIAWDVDDVLNELMRSWLEKKWLVENPVCRTDYEGITENPPHRILGAKMEEYLTSLDEFRLSGMYQQMLPVREIRDWFVAHGSGFRHIALTATPVIAASASAQWVFRHFGTWIRTFHFVPSERQDVKFPVYDENKQSFMQWLGKVDIFVDDNTEHIEKAGMSGIRTYLFPRPWNKGQMAINEILEEIAGL